MKTRHSFAVLCLAFVALCFAPPARAGLNSNSTVFVIMMENHNWSSILGSASAPYLNNTVLPQASYCDQYFNPAANHPSEPNYLWLEAGTNFGINNDNPPSSNQQATTSHFVTQLKNAGISWKAYQEGITGTTCPTSDNTGAGYYVKHNPMAFFTDVTGAAANPTCTSVMRPFSEFAGDLVNNNVAHYNFLTPSICNDMHDTCAPTNDSIKQGDNWLAANLPGILASSAYQNNGLVIITWDEGAGSSDGPIGCIVLSPQAKGGGYHSAIRYTHGSTLRTLQKIFGTSPFLGGAKMGPDLSDLFVAGAIPNADTTPFPASATETTGVVVVEAENFDANISPRSSHEWEPGSSVAGFSGTGYMEALPNNATQIASAGITSPELQYLINFTSTGTHYVWIKGHATANTDDSAFVGIDGGGAVSMTLSTTNAWQWSNAVTTGTNQISVGTTGNHTISVWMREDGLRLDRLLITTNATFSPTLGNCWHIPNSSEGGILNGGTMRSPLAVPSGSNVTIYNGNQFQGAGTVGNQLQTGSTVFYRKSTDSTWSSVPMLFFVQNGNNKYFSATIPSSGFSGGDIVQYYLKVPYSDHLPTYLYGTDSGSVTTEFEATAQASPFTFIVKQPLTPPNGAAFHSFNSTSGSYQARIFDDSSHLALAGPDLNGNPLANVITFAPPSATVNGISYDFGKVLSFTPISNGLQLTQQVAGTTITSQLTFSSEGIMHYEVTNWNGLTPTETDIAAASDVSEHFYGFGEKFNSFDQSGNRVDIMTNDQGGDKNDFTYKSSSWFVSTKGYGFHLDSSAESFFDMRKTLADRYTVQNIFSTLKFNVVAGPKLTDVLTRYTGLTGRPYLPPPWVFGTWVSSDIWRTGGEVRYAITKYKDSGIPISTFVFDSPWEVSYNDFTWNMTQFGVGGTYESTTSHPSATYAGFASLNEMMTFFQQNGVKVVLWFTPFINTSSFNDNVGGATPGQNTGKSPNYDFAASNGYFVKTAANNSAPLSVGWWKGTGSPVDFTNPAATNWFLTTQLQPVLDGSKVTTANNTQEAVVGGFKTDDGEALNSGAPYIPTTASYFDGRTGVEMRNGYSVAYHGAISSLLGSNGILFSRSGFNGNGRFPAGWPGDNQPNYTQANGLQSVITAGDCAAMSGFSIWGHDIGGYQNANFTPDHADLFMRWAQYGCFTPIMQMHRQVNTGNLEQYPWGYGTTALNNYVTYTKLHSQLFPYIYTYAKEASVDGLPLIRPLVLLNPADTSTYAVQHTYFFGNELLVAPMNAASSTSRNVQLPAGNFYDYWTNVKYPGSQTLVWSNSDTTKIPLFVKEGSIVPMLQNVPQTLCDANYVNNPALATMDSALQFLVYPGPGSSSFTMYDGTSAQCSAAGSLMTASVTSAARSVVFKIFMSSAPVGVEENGLRMPPLASLNDVNNPAITFGWFYDSAGKFLYAKFQHAGGTSTLGLGATAQGDGVTDSWRAYYGITDDTADNDGDGLTNAQEYFAGTNPNDAQSAFKIQSVTPQGDGTFLVSWPSQLGIVYRVQWKNNLSDLGWSSITPDFTGTGAMQMWNDDGTQTGGLPAMQRFYRVTVP